MSLKRYNGSSWVDVNNVRRYNGSSWTDCSSMKKYDGSWKDVWPDAYIAFAPGSPAGNLCKFIYGRGKGDILPLEGDNLIAIRCSTQVQSYGMLVMTTQPVNISSYSTFELEYGMECGGNGLDNISLFWWHDLDLLETEQYLLSVNQSNFCIMPNAGSGTGMGERLKGILHVKEMDITPKFYTFEKQDQTNYWTGVMSEYENGLLYRTDIVGSKDRYSAFNSGRCGRYEATYGYPFRWIKMKIDISPLRSLCSTGYLAVWATTVSGNLSDLTARIRRWIFN